MTKTFETNTMGLWHGEVWILGLTILAPFFLSLKVTDEVYIFSLLVILTAMFKLSWSIKSYIWPQEEKSTKKIKVHSANS